MDIVKTIKQNITPEQIIKNWTPLNGYKGDDIIIKRITDSGIEFEAPNTIMKTTTRGSVPYSAIEQIYELWPDIKSGKIKRNEYTNSGIKPNHYTRYCLNILKELDNLGLI